MDADLVLSLLRTLMQTLQTMLNNNELIFKNDVTRPWFCAIIEKTMNNYSDIRDQVLEVIEMVTYCAKNTTIAYARPVD